METIYYFVELVGGDMSPRWYTGKRTAEGVPVTTSLPNRAWMARSRVVAERLADSLPKPKKGTWVVTEHAFT